MHLISCLKMTLCWLMRMHRCWYNYSGCHYPSIRRPLAERGFLGSKVMWRWQRACQMEEMKTEIKMLMWLNHRQRGRSHTKKMVKLLGRRRQPNEWGCQMYYKRWRTGWWRLCLPQAEACLFCQPIISGNPTMIMNYRLSSHWGMTLGHRQSLMLKRCGW